MNYAIPRIKECVPLLELAGEYIRLRKAGARHVGLCPFHSEKTGSFGVHNEGFFYCFGCGSKGDVITFYSMIEGISVGAAIKQLADRAGIPLDSKPVTKRQRIYDRQKQEFCKWWQARKTEEMQAQLVLYVRLLDNLTTEEECEALGAVLRQVRGVRGQELRGLVERCATGEERRKWGYVRESDQRFREVWMSLAKEAA